MTFSLTRERIFYSRHYQLSNITHFTGHFGHGITSLLREIYWLFGLAKIQKGFRVSLHSITIFLLGKYIY